MKFKRFRLFLDDLHGLAHGWSGRFATGKEKPVNRANLLTVAAFTTRIRRREGLGEINTNRVRNMERGCAQIDGLLLHPGEIFSFRRLIGEPRPETGYLDGPLISRGRLSFTAGGGLCQVSTTVFNAALIAGLTILEKHHHSVDIWGENRLVELGRDATYVYGRKDLKFRNDTKETLVIRAGVDVEAEVVYCRILAANPLPYEVHVQSVVRKIEPNQCPPERCRPIPGWVVTTVRTVGTARGERVTYRRRERYKPVYAPPNPRPLP